jgi:hypothetical protein
MEASIRMIVESRVVLMVVPKLIIICHITVVMVSHMRVMRRALTVAIVLMGRIIL